jgi:6-phospho-3-hexuloisomerase
MDQSSDRFGSWLTTTGELSRVFATVDPREYERFSSWFDRIDDAHRVFFSGQGRSGLSAEMVAMRFTHLGLRAHFVSEATAPSVRSGDTFVVVSGSGKTPVSIGFARTAKKEGAAVLLVSHESESELRTIADAAVILPTAGSTQFGGTLFEESALILLDSIVLDQMRRRAIGPGTMMYNHTNLQ